MMYPKAGTIRGYGFKNIVNQDFSVDGNRFNNPGNAYISGTAPYGKFGWFCEACDNILVYRVGMLSNTGYGFDPHGTGQTMIFSRNMTFRECWVLLFDPRLITITGTVSLLIK
jgi:hypothetical protein